MHLQTKSLIFLIILCIVDVVIPIPILGLICIYIVLQKPPWFVDGVRKIFNIK